MRFAVGLLCVLAVSACGGGGGSSEPAPAAPSRLTANFSFTLPVPSRATSTRRSPQYVSPSSASIAISVVYPSGTVPGAIINVAPPSAVCTVTGSTETCIVAVVATAGATQFAIDVYDQPNAQGNLLSADTVPVPATPNGYANVSVTLLPVAAGVSVVLAPPLVPGVAGTSTLTITTLDADGNPIPAGPLDQPVTLVSSSSHLILSTTSITDSSQPVTITYDGTLIPGATLTATAGVATYTFAPFGAAASGPLVVSPPDLMLQVGGPTGTFSVGETGSGGTIAVTTTCVEGAQITVSPSSIPIGPTPGTVTVTAVTAPSGTPTHACTLTFTSATASATATVDVNASSVGIDAVRR